MLTARSSSSATSWCAPARRGGLPAEPATALTRLDQLEAELRRLTDRVDVLTNDIDRIVEDASNQVGDIEFRLTELEGGDTSVKPASRRRSAAASPGRGRGRSRRRSAPPARPATLAVDRAVGLRRGRAAADAGDNAKAAALFGDLPRRPIRAGRSRPRRSTAAARRWRRTGDWRGAARSFLDAFSGAPQGPLAPHALYQLAVSLGKLGQTDEACLTLTEVDSRYPGSRGRGRRRRRSGRRFACQ